MKVYVSSDHGGFALKAKILEHLRQKGHESVDLGPQTLDPTDDFPTYTAPLAQRVSEEPDSRGIVICRNGVGVSIVANKFDKVRCGLSFSEAHTKSARRDDDINVLALASDYLPEEEELKIVDAFLDTPFAGEERFKRRIEEISDIEERS